MFSIISRFILFFFIYLNIVFCYKIFFLSKKIISGLRISMFFFISLIGALGDRGTQMFPDKIIDIDKA